MINTKFLTYKIASFNDCTMDDLFLVLVGLLILNIPLAIVFSAIGSSLVGGKFSAWFLGTVILLVILNYKISIPLICRKIASLKQGKEPMFLRLLLKKQFGLQSSFVHTEGIWVSKK